MEQLKNNQRKLRKRIENKINHGSEMYTRRNLLEKSKLRRKEKRKKMKRMPKSERVLVKKLKRNSMLRLNIIKKKKLNIKVFSGLKARKDMIVIWIQIPHLLLPVADSSTHQMTSINHILELLLSKKLMGILEKKLNLIQEILLKNTMQNKRDLKRSKRKKKKKKIN